MTVAPPEPDADPTENDPAQTPDLPDPEFPEVLPGGDPGPGGTPEPEPETEPSPEGP